MATTTTMTTRRPKGAPHKHLWVDRGWMPRGQWPYACSVCGAKSRNTLCQAPEFQGPLTITSTILVGPGAGTTWTWQTDDGRATPRATPQATPQDAVQDAVQP